MIERVEVPERRYGPPGVIAAVILVFVIIVIVAAVATNTSMHGSTGPSVDITGLSVTSPDNACGLNGDDSGTVQMNMPGGGMPTISWGLPGPSGSLPCTVSSASTNTPGFVLIGSFPFTATSFPSVLIVSMETPSSFHGILNVTFT